MKRAVFLGLVLICIVVSWFLNGTKNTIDTGLKAGIEGMLLDNGRFPARPVWWQDDSVLAVGVIKKSDNHDQDAITVCSIAKEHGVTELLVEIYDILEIQQSDNWVRIGSANCAALVQ